MKYAIISDVHANVTALECVLADARANGAEKIVCLGDVVGYGPLPAETLALVQEQGEAARRLAYQLHTLCERKGLAEDARPYNELVAAWDDIAAAAAKAIAAAPKKPKQEQLELGI